MGKSVPLDYNNPDLTPLKHCLQTKIITKDGASMVLFHSEPLTDDEKAELELYTYAELKAIILKSFRNPTMVKV